MIVSIIYYYLLSLITTIAMIVGANPTKTTVINNHLIQRSPKDANCATGPGPASTGYSPYCGH